MAKKSITPATTETRPSRSLTIASVPGRTTAALMADAVVQPFVDNAMVVVDFARPGVGEVDLTATVRSLKEASAKVQSGSLENAEAILTSQAVALNAIFASLARRSAETISGGHIEVGERFLRLALKAQAQSRTTLETLASIKNPPVIYARQANIANGPQQVNNHAPKASVKDDIVTPTKLLEANLGERLDGRAAVAAITGDPALEAVGAVDRTEDT